MSMTPFCTNHGVVDSCRAYGQAMVRSINIPSQSAWPVFYLFVLVSLMSIVGAFAGATPALSQTLNDALPANAQASQYGIGWVCDQGYQKQDAACTKIIVPENAYLTKRRYDQGWACLRGFKESAYGMCVDVEIPENAFLTSSGNRWECARGYRDVNGRCEEINLPKNAYLSDKPFTSEWQCQRGYQVEDTQCTPIQLPQRAFLNTTGYGNPWSCERGFIESKGQCLAIRVPDNGFLADAAYGNGWKCERGYVEIDEKCSQIRLPANAHLDRSGARWECDPNFKRKGERCAKSN